MFTIDSEATVKPYPLGIVADPEDSGVYINTKVELAALILAKPSEWGVKLWNDLPGAPLILTGKFRNRATAVDRIWQKLCELYPDAVSSEVMPKAKKRNAKVDKAARITRNVLETRTVKRSQRTQSAETGNGRKSAWAEELTTELQKRFNPGQEFSLEDVYRLIPAFQRRHPDNKNVAARLRATVAQDLRGRGIVKALKRGQYRMAAA